MFSLGTKLLTHRQRVVDRTLVFAQVSACIYERNCLTRLIWAGETAPDADDGHDTHPIRRDAQVLQDDGCREVRADGTRGYRVDDWGEATPASDVDLMHVREQRFSQRG